MTSITLPTNTADAMIRRLVAVSHHRHQPWWIPARRAMESIRSSSTIATTTTTTITTTTSRIQPQPAPPPTKWWSGEAAVAVAAEVGSPLGRRRLPRMIRRPVLRSVATTLFHPGRLCFFLPLQESIQHDPPYRLAWNAQIAPLTPSSSSFTAAARRGGGGWVLLVFG